MAGSQLVWNEQEQLRKPLMWSATGHVCLVAGIIAATLVRGKMTFWGEAGGGGAATVNLVSSASVPLPSPTIPTENHVATENPALHYTEPPQAKSMPLPTKLDEKAIPLPAKNAKVAPPKKTPEVKPKEEPPPTRRELASTDRTSDVPPQQSRVRRPPQDVPPPTNEVPYGEGGPAAGPYGMFQTDTGSGGMRMSGDSGDFVSRYSAYVTAIRNRVSGNWLKSTVDPSVRVAPRVYVTFQILKDGRVVNSQVTASSGIFSLDNSALRAVLDSSPMPPLPPDYPGANVSVEFWFDFRR